MASGVVPQISVVLGPCAGGAVYSPAITDFIFMVEEIGQMYITGPSVVEAATGEIVTHEQLGGASTHATTSGVAHFAYSTEEECLEQVRRLLSFLPQNNMDDVPNNGAIDDINRMVADLGGDLDRLDSAKETHEYEIELITKQLDDVENIDSFEAINRFQSLRSQIEASYQITAASRGFSLLNFL